MKNIVIALALSSTAVLASVSCGDSASESEKGGTGGASGAAGSATTGGSGVTGGTAGTAGTGGAATGGAAGSAGTPATGGASGTAGTGADGGVGAEGGNGNGGNGEGGDGPGAGCPMNEPMATTMCGTRGLSCDFGDRTCRCGLNTGNWQCFDTNGDCPAMRDPGGNCMGGGTACSYGTDGTCVCMAGNFTCDAGVVACPAMRPMDGGGCNMFPAGFDCAYTAGDCTCQAAGGAGTMRTWNCPDSACPAMAPNDNAMCPTPGLICEYTTPGPAADPTCICNTMSRWTCL